MMEFKEKLQLLRTNLKLSQEELADRLNISRQSITKWENGQSFPDIQNLIQLSEIFKVSIDRLVKENDTCTISLFCEQNIPCRISGFFWSGRKIIPISRVKMKSCRHSPVPMTSVMRMAFTCIWILTLADRNS